MSNRADMKGKRFGQLIARHPIGKKKNGNIVWLLECDCGEAKEADGYDVRSGKIISCNKCGAERTRLASVTHGMSNTPEFSTWDGMKSRCYNKNVTHYSKYGGRGIKVCQRWLESFENFYADMGQKPSGDHSIERRDNDGDYSPDNCIWATAREQALNRKTNVYLTINDTTRTMIEWSEISGVSLGRIWSRKKAGYSGEDLINPRYIGSLTFRGITKTQKEWSEITGIKKSTIAMRINKYKWPIEKTLTKGGCFA